MQEERDSYLNDEIEDVQNTLAQLQRQKETWEGEVQKLSANCEKASKAYDTQIKSHQAAKERCDHAIAAYDEAAREKNRLFDEYVALLLVVSCRAC
jgi:predicted  nucleic acid-binding Zn-ribbon protein